MLRRSFKPAKCKTSLKLATYRLKLMKNKKLVQINQMKRELSQLLETGQDRTARIRVEHVIREEKMVAAYDLVEIYCELIAARLPIIESQKICPIDLKEAVTSVIYASPRCSDIPELQYARKHFTTKYGKEFISAAIELRPDSGVGRMLIEKLSTVAPDVQTKIKLLSAVAEEYNINWDPNALEEKESKPPDDLLNGPNTFEKASVMHADPRKYQAAPNVHDQERNEPFNYFQQNLRSSLGTGNYASTDARASGRDPERMEVRQSFPRDGDDNSLYDRRNWNMDFTDATDAAQAAAECAERASMAARAAAQLSRQENEEKAARYYSRGSYNNSFSDKKPKVQDQQAAERFNEDGYGRRSSRTASLRSRSNFVPDDNSVNTEQKVHGYSKESSFQEKFLEAEKGTTSSPEMSTRERTRRASTVELDNRWHDSFKSDSYHGEEMKRSQSSTSSSRSHSMSLSGKYKETTRPSIYDGVADDVASDESESDEDGDGPRFDTFEFDEVDAKSFFPSPGRESPEHKKMNKEKLNPIIKSSSINSSASRREDKISSVSPIASNFSSFKSTLEETRKSQFEPPPRFYDHDGDDSVDDSPKGKSSNKVHLGTRLSRRSPREESLKSQAAAEQPSRPPQRKRVESSDPGVDKASNSGGGTSTGVNIIKKATHVHPNLPDYDDIAARLQALRMNR